MIVKAFNATVEWLGQACKDIAQFFVNAWNGIKAAWGAVANWFSGIWQSIKNIFASVGSWFKNLFTDAWKNIKNVFASWGEFFGGLWDTIKEKFSSLGTSIGNAIGGAVKAGINGVISLIENTINGAIGLINGGIDLINLLPGVRIGYVPTLSLPRLAKGGITSGPTTALIGEAGKEAVLPLENNTEWMNVLADKIANRSNTPSRIVLMLDGKELGWAAINNINGITRQSGNLPLVLG